MKNDDQIKLFYLKILALGPGQIGKSTFIRRLLGIMKWDIDKDPENLPPGSTGLSERREVFLDYNHESVALSTDQSASALSTEESWHLLDKADVGRELRALVSLLKVQTKSSEVSTMASLEQTKEISPMSIQPSSPIPLSQPSDVEKSDQLITVSTSEETQNVFPSSKQSPEYQNISLSRSEIDEAYEEFENLRYSSSSDSLDDDLKSLHAIINIADVGGQPAFLELLYTILDN